MVHQGDAGETRVRRREGDAAQPVERVLAPREPSDLEDHPRPGARAASGPGLPERRLGAGSSADTTRTSQPSAVELRARCRACGEAVRRALGLGPAGRAAALRARHTAGGVSNTTATGGESGRAGQRRPGRAVVRVQAERVDDHREAAPARVPRRSGRAAETRRRTRRGRRCRCPPRRAARRRTPPRRRGSGPRPRSTSRSRPRRPAAPEPGREPAHRQCGTGVDSQYENEGVAEP